MSTAPKSSSRAERLLAEFHEERPIASQALDWQMLRDLYPYARPFLKYYIGSLLLMPVGVACMLVQPRLLQRAVDAVGVGQSQAALGKVSLLFGGVIALRFLAGFSETYLMQLAGQRTMASLRGAVFAHIQRLSIRYFDETPVGRIVTRVTNDIDSLGELFASGAVTALGDLLLLFGIVVSMLVLDHELALVAFAAVPPLVFAVEMFRRKLRHVQRVIRARIAQLNAYLNEQVQGIQVVQAFSREAESAAGYREINQAYREAFRRSISADAMMFSVVEAIAAICVGMVLFYAARRLGMAGTESEAQKGTFIAFYAYIQLFFVPLRELSSKYTMIQSAFASAERVFGLLSVREFDAAASLPEQRAELPTAPLPKTPVEVLPVIAFDHVDFRYHTRAPLVLEHVSFAVARGETIAIVGATGAGKTTVTALAQRFYDVSAGAVRVDGRDVRSYAREELRERFALVQQDVFLFAGDLLANVALGDERPDPARAARALEQVGALAMLEPRGGLALRISERGTNLSSGERQLVAFARALYRDPQVLILDEATASIDSETEARLQGALDALLVGRTAVIIAHRLSTVRRADRILVFHRGRIVEQGSHTELLEQGGVYARLYELQFASAPEPPDAVATQPGELAAGSQNPL
ncbi:MAG: ABC transporter ATP-binding protein [Myxococcales bacterium]